MVAAVQHDPLRPEELATVREMIAAFQYDLRRAAAWSGRRGAIARAIGAVAALMVVANAIRGMIGL